MTIETRAVPHEHDWERILRWSGRYRCKSCGGIGYRGVISANEEFMNNRGGASAIIPYRCRRRVDGRPCGKIAVFVKDYKGRCAEHMPRAA